MPNNFFITGAPGIGKTTVVQEVGKRLQAKGYQAGGVYCPEIRENGKRKGFKIVDILNGQSAVLSHVDALSGPQVGRFKVQVENINQICEQAFPSAYEYADYLVIDEIAPMELYNLTFKNYVLRSVESIQPLLAVIHRKRDQGFIGKLKTRKDLQLIEVNKHNRKTLPKTIEPWIAS